LTTIFYDGKNLHADYKAMQACFPTRMTMGTDKLFTSPNNTIAIGISGVIPNEKVLSGLFEIATIMFKKMYSGTFNDVIDLKESNVDLRDRAEVDFIAMTSNKAFMCRDSVLYPQTGFAGALGTGFRSIVGCYYVLRDVKKAFFVSSQIDTLSSAACQSIQAESLNPFVME
jgi:hypothetical protein